MSSPRERQLAEGLKNRLIGIQKSKQIYEKLSKLERKVLEMDEKEIVRVAELVASKVERRVVNIENSGSTPAPQEVMKIIQEELGKV